MPSINDSRKTVETSIPSVAGSKITLWDNLTVGDADKIQEQNTEMSKGIATIFALIKEWNLDEPLTMESVRCLSPDDFSFLLNQTELGKMAKLSKAEREEIEVEKKTD